MAGIGLSKALNGDVLRRFAALASKSQSPAAALRGPLGQDQAITSGLRIGARTFTSALDGLNGAVSFVNLSQKSLQDLSVTTDKLIAVTRQASDVATSSTTRKQLDIEFKRLAGEFRRTVKNATTGDNEFLTKSGLEEIFATIGLDKKASQSIAAIFSRFVTPLSDDSLASEKVAGNHVQIPVGAFRTRESDASHLVDRVSSTGIDDGIISSVNGMYSDQDTLLGQNPGFKSVLVADTNGSTTSFSAGSVSSGVEILAVNESSGYGLVISSSDFLGTNPAGVEQIYLVDNTGVVIQQFTDNGSATVSYTTADLSADSKQIAYVAVDSSAGSSVQYVSVASFGSHPAGLAPTTIDTYSLIELPPSAIKISNSGNHIAYRADATLSLQMYEIGSGFSATVAGYSSNSQFGFIADDELLIAQSGGSVDSVSWSGLIGILSPGVTNISNFTTLEGIGFAFFDSSDDAIKRYNSVGTLQDTVQLSASDSIERLSLALNRDGSHVDLGITGQIVTFGDSDTQLYRVRTNPAYSNGLRYSAATPGSYDSITGEQLSSIFDDSRSIEDRGQAYRTLDDLYALKEQLSANIKALDGARDTLSENIKLVRATGLAFLEAAGQVRSSTDAEVLAESLRQRIRDSAPTALSQAENLNPLIVAALTYGAS